MSLSRKGKVILTVILIIVIAVTVVYQYSMRPPKKIENKEVLYTGTADELLQKNQEDANAWQDKVVVITGKITSKDGKGCILSSGVFCQFKDPTQLSSISEEQEITLKGRVIGYDDLLEELKIDQCIIQ